MPIFSCLGVYTGNDQSQFVKIKLKQPVFVFGEENSGLTSIAIALMVLGILVFIIKIVCQASKKKGFGKKRKKLF